MISHIVMSSDHGILHLNKNYYAPGEKIWFSGFLSQVKRFKDDTELVAKLLHVSDSNQRMVKAIKVRTKSHAFSGQMDISLQLYSGYYILALFAINEGVNTDPILSSTLYIYNPQKKKPVENISEINQ